MGDGPVVAVDGTTFTYTYFGGAVRYLSGLCAGFKEAGCRVFLVMSAAPKCLGPHLPVDVPIVEHVPSGTAVWLTDQAQGVVDAVAWGQVLIVHDTLEWESGIEMPRGSGSGVSVSDIKGAVSACNLVLSPSFATLESLRRLLCGTDLRRCLRIPHALSLPDRSVAETSMHGSTILHVGGRDGYKSFDLLLQAFSEFSEETPASLVTIGGRARFTEAEFTSIEKLGLDGRVRSLGYISDDELVRWYAAARVVVLPSAGEGYGVPMLEALAMGTPVVAADLPVVAEVTSGRAHTFDPGQAASLTAAMRRAWSDPTSAHERAVIADQIRQWTWGDAARTLFDYLSDTYQMVETPA